MDSTRNERIVPQPNDVLLGRGSALMFHPGNLRYRQLVRDRKAAYCSFDDQTHKQDIASSILDIIREDGGRFLERRENSSQEETWCVVNDRRALEKTKQSLREKRGKRKGSDMIPSSVQKSRSPVSATFSIQDTMSTLHQIKDRSPPINVTNTAFAVKRHGNGFDHHSDHESNQEMPCLYNSIMTDAASNHIRRRQEELFQRVLRECQGGKGTDGHD